TVGIICYILFTYFERNDIITYRQNYKETKSNTFSSPIKTLVSRSIIKFTFVSILTGVIRTSVMFWLPTYLLQYLSFGERQSTTIFTVISLIISIGSFAAAFIYKLLKNSINKTLLFSFALSDVLFLAPVIVKNEIVNIILFVIAIMASNCAATMMWSFYCPSLADTGLVSSATGYLDFISYMSAAISSKLFANAVGGIGWGGLIMVWFALMLAGVIISIPYKKRCEI
ncbi:MAG: MFS transporter, partial [Clostridia bacterium]|nr:MFS transporter [Clostridia bacterium]